MQILNVFNSKAESWSAEGVTNTFESEVEVYDHVADDWSVLSRMNDHGMVAVRSKLFVFGRKTCEVFDSGKFANLRAKAPNARA